MRGAALLLLAGCCVVGGGVSSREYSVGGLWVDSSSLSQAPAGAMDEALNVVIRRPGMAEARPAFAQTVGDTVDTPVEMLNYANELLVVEPNPYTTSGGGTAMNDADGNPIVNSLNTHLPHARARGNLYMMGNNGLHKFVNTLSDVARARLSPPNVAIASLSTSGSFLGTTKAVSYRLTAEFEDANGVTLVSPPTGAMIVGNHHASNTYNVTVRAYLTDQASGDIIRLYRTRQVTSTAATPASPSDDHFLTDSYKLTSSDVSTGYVDFTDDRADNDLGAALYTNPAQEGIAGSNYQPPRAGDMELYQRSVFYANATLPVQRPFTVTMGTGGVSTSVDQSGNATGIGVRSATGDVSTGVNTITNVSDTTGLQVGMIVTELTYFSGTPTIITAINGSTVTVSENSSGTTTGTTVLFYDSIRIDNDYYVAHLSELTLQTAADYLGDGPNGYTVVSGGVAGRANIAASGSVEVPELEYTKVLRRIDAANDSILLYATHGDEYFPPIPLPSETGETVTNDVQKNALFYSKTSQPEHVPIGNHRFVGAGDAPIQRIMAGNNALWVFKTDGIFRLVGAGPLSGWRDDRISGSHALIRRSYVAELEGFIYAWTNQGIVRVGEDGIRPLSRGRIQSLIQAHQDAMGVDNTTYSTAAAGSAWVSPSKREVYFSDTTGGYVYVYNTTTDTWTRWSAPATARGNVTSGTELPENFVLYLGAADSGSGDAVVESSGTESGGFVAEMQWSDQGDDYGMVSRFSAVHFLFDDLDGTEYVGGTFTGARVTFTSSTDASADNVDRTGPGTSTPGVMGPYFVPRDHALAQRLSAKLSLNGYNGAGAVNGWKVIGMRSDSAVATTRQVSR